jgi:hypothetical protein
MKYLVMVIAACLLIPLMSDGQVKTGNDGAFDIYIFPAFYSKNVRDYLLQNNCSEAHLLTQSMIDPDKDQQPDLDVVKKYTAELYPEANATGLFVVDWEAQAFNDLRKYDKNDSRFKAAEAAYIRLVNSIKEYRPGLKVAVYGLPFRFFSNAQRVQDGDNKLDGLLSKCDVLTPSLYIMYPNEEVGEQRNMDYLKQNMDQFLIYGARLKKPVIPFFWYKVHPGNKKYGMTVMTQDKVQKYLTLLSTYSNQAGKINGIIWWEGGEKIDKKPAAKRGLGAAAAGTGAPQNEIARDSIIIKYTAPFIKKKKQ